MKHHLLGGFGLERLLLQRRLQTWKPFLQLGAMLIGLLVQQTHHQDVTSPVLQAGGREESRINRPLHKHRS